MKTKIKISTSQVKAIQDGRIRGVDLAKKLGINLQSMWQALRNRYGYKTRRPKNAAKLSKKNIADYKAGKESSTTLAEKIGCSAPTIISRLRALKLTKIRTAITTQRSKFKADQRRKKYAAMFKAGKSLSEIAREEGVSPQRISQIMVGMFRTRKSGWRPVWCTKCKTEMLASKPLKVICPKCADLSKVTVS